MDGLPRHSRTADFNTRVTRVTAWGAFPQNNYGRKFRRYQ